MKLPPWEYLFLSRSTTSTFRTCSTRSGSFALVGMVATVVLYNVRTRPAAAPPGLPRPVRMDPLGGRDLLLHAPRLRHLPFLLPRRRPSPSRWASGSFSGSASCASHRSSLPTRCSSPGPATTRSRSSPTRRRPSAPSAPPAPRGRPAPSAAATEGDGVCGRGGSMEIRRFGVGQPAPRRPARDHGGRRPGDPRGRARDRSRSWPSPVGRASSRTPTRNTTWFVVIEGGGMVRVGEERARVAAGEAVLWPADVPHAAWTELSEMRALVVELAGPGRCTPARDPRRAGARDRRAGCSRRRPHPRPRRPTASSRRHPPTPAPLRDRGRAD